MNKPIRLSLLVSSLALGMAVPASAEIIYLTSNKTISVKSHRIEGNTIYLTLRNGGEVSCDKSLVDRIVPDEVPHPDPEPPAEDAESIAAAVDPSLLEQTPYGDIIAAMSEAHGVNPMLVRALIEVESNYRPKAKSNKGAMGLMQLMPSTAREYNVRNPYDPKANIAAGVKHLAKLIETHGVELALAAYNAG